MGAERLVTAGAFAIILASVLPLPRSFAAQPRWLTATSPNFELLTDESDARARDILFQFETARAFFLPAMQVLGLNEAPVQIVAFRSSADYLRYCPNSLRWTEVTAPPPEIDAADYSGEFQEFCAAAYLLRSPLRSSVVMMTGPRFVSLGASPPFVQDGWKSFVGLALEGSGSRLPPRLKVALKEFYGWVRPVVGQLKVYVPFMGLYHSARTSTSGKHNPDYVLLHMLALGPAYRSNFLAALKALGNGEDRNTALSRIYGRSVSQVEKDLKAYPGHPARGPGVPVELAQPFAPEVRPATPAESEGVLAELKANMAPRER